MSDNWEMITKPIGFKDFIHKYLYLNRLRYLRDFIYSYNEANRNLTSNKLLNNQLNSPLNRPLNSPLNRPLINQTKKQTISEVNMLFPDWWLKIKSCICCGYISKINDN